MDVHTSSQNFKLKFTRSFSVIRYLFSHVRPHAGNNNAVLTENVIHGETSREKLPSGLQKNFGETISVNSAKKGLVTVTAIHSLKKNKFQ